MNELFNVKDKVVVLDRSEEAGKALVDSIKAEGNEAMFLYTDVMDKEVLEGNKVEIMKAYLVSSNFSLIGIEYSLNMNMSSRSVFENILY